MIQFRVIELFLLTISHQINLAAPPQCNNVRVLLEHSLQINKHN